MMHLFRTGMLAAAVLALCAGCSSTPPATPTPPPARPAVASQPPPTPQEMLKAQIDGINENPRFTAADKKMYIAQVKHQMTQMMAEMPPNPNAGNKPAAAKAKESPEPKEAK